MLLQCGGGERLNFGNFISELSDPEFQLLFQPEPVGIPEIGGGDSGLSERLLLPFGLEDVGGGVIEAGVLSTLPERQSRIFLAAQRSVADDSGQVVAFPAAVGIDPQERSKAVADPVAFGRAVDRIGEFLAPGEIELLAEFVEPVDFAAGFLHEEKEGDHENQHDRQRDLQKDRVQFVLFAVRGGFAVQELQQLRTRPVRESGSHDVTSMRCGFVRWSAGAPGSCLR